MRPRHKTTSLEGSDACNIKYYLSPPPPPPPPPSYRYITVPCPPEFTYFSKHGITMVMIIITIILTTVFDAAESVEPEEGKTGVDYFKGLTMNEILLSSVPVPSSILRYRPVIIYPCANNS